MSQSQLRDPVTVESGRLTVGIAAHGNVDVTTKCLRSVFSSVKGEFELILVDDASPDNMLNLFLDARACHAGTRIYRFGENKEYSHSVNCILSHAQTEFVLFVSNDIFITPAYVRALLEVGSDSTIGVARGVSNYVDAWPTATIHNVKIKDGVISYDDLVEFAHKQYMSVASWASKDAVLTGDAFMVKKQLIDHIGGFDTAFRGYFSDVDFGIRAAHANYKRIVCEKAFAWHQQGANMFYLPDQLRREKFAIRLNRVASAWKVFRKKWSLFELPEEWQPDLVVPRIPFEKLDEMSFDSVVDYVPKINYSSFQVS